MQKGTCAAFIASGFLSALTLAPAVAAQAIAKPYQIAPDKMPRIGTISERFQSYNVEMVEVTGGRFWKPYASTKAQESGGNAPAGMSASLYEFRKPIDLYNPRLRKLAAALGPAYVRVSGTWANTTYFQAANDQPMDKAPDGFKAVLTRAQWKGVIDFSNAVDAPIVTSVAISTGVRDASGMWTAVQAGSLLDFTKANNGKIAAIEFMNEPTMPEMGGSPKGYSAADFAKDLAVFHAFVKNSAPKTIILGPDSVGEESKLLSSLPNPMKAEDILAGGAQYFDAFSYHTYGAVSSRCSSMGPGANTTLAVALGEDWLSRGDQGEQFYGALRDRYMPGKAMWNTETAQAACGGDRWASTFVDSFRYLNQLGDLARRGVQVQMHNTLAASDYGLLQEYTFEPRPNYWSALLWRRLMGTTVLDPGASPGASLHLYASCLRNHPGGVVLLAINASETDAQSFNVPVESQRYTLTAKDLTAGTVQLNGADLNLGPDDSLPELKGRQTPAGTVAFASKSITFLAMPNAQNVACMQ